MNEVDTHVERVVRFERARGVATKARAAVAQAVIDDGKGRALRVAVAAMTGHWLEASNCRGAHLQRDRGSAIQGFTAPFAASLECCGVRTRQRVERELEREHVGNRRLPDRGILAAAEDDRKGWHDLREPGPAVSGHRSDGYLRQNQLLEAHGLLRDR